MPEDLDVYIRNDNTLVVTGVRDANAAVTTYLNAAAVTATLYDERGVAVVGQSWPITCAYVPASNGVYQGNLDDSLILGNHSGYTVDIEIDNGSDNKAHFRRSVRGVYR